MAAMTTWVALLRAVNVGGTGKLAMSDLRALCEEAGFERVTTYIASGNVVFRSALQEKKIRALLEKALAAKLGKPVGLLLRTSAQLAGVLADNPFPAAPPDRLLVLFLEAPPPPGALSGVVVPGREELALRGRELFVHYPDGQGRSKLKLPLSSEGTARNLNTVGKLVELARAD